MIKHTNIYRSKGHAIVVKESDLAGIVNYIIDIFQECSISAKCSEGSELHFDSIDGLLGYENPDFRHIQEVTIKYRNDEATGTFKIGNSLFTNYSVHVTDSDDSRAIKVANEMSARLADCRPWYSAVTRIPYGFVPMILFGAFLCIFYWQAALRTGALEKSPDVAWFPLLVMIIPLAIPLVALFIYSEKFWDWSFPKVCFLIGRQNEKFNKQEKTRQFLLGTVLIGFIVGLLVEWIS